MSKKHQTINPEIIVVEWINGERPVPQEYEELVEEYVSNMNIVDQCASYPRWIDERMNEIFDGMVAFVSQEVRN